MPDVVNAPASYLVVDGFINGNGATRLKLSRTLNIAATSAPAPEKGARVFIVDNTGARYALREKSSGFYQSDSLLLNPARQYQLSIATGNGPATAASYESDLVPLKVTPPIDRLSWRYANSQAQILLDTHDPTAQTRYYRWSFSETFQFTAAYESHLEYINGTIQDRVTPIYTCWRTENPSVIQQASSAQLSQDALLQQQVLTVPDHAEKLRIRYSVLVSQYAETAAEFAYYEVLRKNTEAVGTVNDPLPSQLTGNVHRVGSAEPVLGFVGAHTVQTKRLFINNQDLQLPANWHFDSPYDQCGLGIEYLCDPYGNCIIYPKAVTFALPSNTPTELSYDAAGNIDGYRGSTTSCVDCRTRGTNVKPSFW